MLAYLFPGQGSQFKGMGNKLFDHFPEICQQADEILGYSIKKLCTEDPNQELNFTQYTQPALFIVNALCYYKTQQEHSERIDFTLGHSLGEYNALLAAGVFDFTTGLRLVIKRSELMREAQSGKMAAIIGLNRQEVADIIINFSLENITIANENSYKQFVVSGPEKDILAAIDIFKNHQANVIPLRVNGAFHSSLMQPVENKFSEYLANFSFSPPFLPVISNIDADVYHPKILKSNLARHISHPVLWTKSIAFLLAQGEITFQEVGPGNVLTGLVERIKNSM